MEVTDARGRKITITPLDPGDVLDLLEAAESASGNAGYVNYAMVVCSVSAIDGVPVPRPGRKDQIRALGKTLGNDGFSAVAAATFGNKEADATVDTAKNS